MYDGKQVVRVINNYKQKDLYNIGVEMNNRKGTGNYDVEVEQAGAITNCLGSVFLK